MDYSKKYWLYQSPIGEFGGWANLIKFKEFIKPSDTVLDFGCGGGYLLENIDAKVKEGLEINKEAIEVARKKSLKIYDCVFDIPDGRFDVIISNHALEHCQRPLDELKSLKTKLKQDGKIIFYVPCESHQWKFRKNDKNQHLYTWSPMNIANLFKAAGYTVIEASPFYHRWPLFYRQVFKISGSTGFHLLSRTYGRLFTKLAQVRCVATL